MDDIDGGSRKHCNLAERKLYHYVIERDEVRAFKGKVFSRWAKKERIDDKDLCIAAKEAFAGKVDGDLGSHLFKKRVARKGGGKSGGYRTILGFRKTNSDRIFFLHGYPKNARSNINSKEHKALAMVATNLIEATDAQIETLKTKGTIAELEHKK
jgi:hypothetical protein